MYNTVPTFDLSLSLTCNMKSPEHEHARENEKQYKKSTKFAAPI